MWHPTVHWLLPKLLHKLVQCKGLTYTTALLPFASHAHTGTGIGPSRAHHAALHTCTLCCHGLSCDYGRLCIATVLAVVGVEGSARWCPACLIRLAWYVCCLLGTYCSLVQAAVMLLWPQGYRYVPCGCVKYVSAKGTPVWHAVMFVSLLRQWSYSLNSWPWQTWIFSATRAGSDALRRGIDVVLCI